MKTKKDRRKHSFFMKLAAFVGCLLIVGGAITIAWVGLHALAIGVLIGGLASVTVPAVVVAEGILDFIVAVCELVIDGIVMVFEAIAGLFG